jgi:hypothetical protein
MYSIACKHILGMNYRVIFFFEKKKKLTLTYTRISSQKCQFFYFSLSFFMNFICELFRYARGEIGMTILCKDFSFAIAKINISPRYFKCQFGVW